jgi:hypothetical protein
MLKSLAMLAALLAIAQTPVRNPIEITKFPAVSISRDWIDWGFWVFSGLLVVVGSLQVWLLWRTLGAISRQADSLEQQVKESRESTAETIAIARKAADSALLNAQAVVNAERALLLFTVE